VYKIPCNGDIIYCVHPDFNYRVQKNTVLEVIREADDVILLHLSNGFLFGYTQIGLCLFYDREEAKEAQRRHLNKTH
jgi:hypothetical protein